MNLEPFQKKHLQLYYDWMRDPHVLGPYVAPDKRSLDELIRDFEVDQWTTDRARAWLLKGENEEIMGYADAWLFDRFESHIEFGRILLPEFRRKGFGKAFLHLVIDKVFDETSAHRVQSITSSSNIAIKKNWAALNFEPEAKLKEYMKLEEGYVDCFLFSVLRPEWRKMHGSCSCLQ